LQGDPLPQRSLKDDNDSEWILRQAIVNDAAVHETGRLTTGSLSPDPLADPGQVPRPIRSRTPITSRPQWRADVRPGKHPPAAVRRPARVKPAANRGINNPPPPRRASKPPAIRASAFPQTAPVFKRTFN